MFTADWVVAAPSHLGALFPSAPTAERSTGTPYMVKGIVVLEGAVPFPSRAGAKSREAEGGEEEDGGVEPDEEKDAPDSSLFVFPPEATVAGGLAVLGTVTALQVGSGTFACPDGHSVVYLSAPILTPPPPGACAGDLLQPYLAKLLARTTEDKAPLFAAFRFLRPATAAPADAPANLLVVPKLADARGTAAGLVTGLDEAVGVAEGLFWKVVGEGAREEGVEFFIQEERAEDDE